MFRTGLRVRQGSERALILLATVASLGCDAGVVSGALIEMKMDGSGVKNSQLNASVRRLWSL